MSEKKPDSQRIRDLSPMGIRLPPDLKEKIVLAAEANGRSLNAEVVARLGATFDHPSAALRHRIRSRDYDQGNSAERPTDAKAPDRADALIAKIHALLTQVGEELAREHIDRAALQSDAPVPTFHEDLPQFNRAPLGAADSVARTGGAQAKRRIKTPGSKGSGA